MSSGVSRDTGPSWSKDRGQDRRSIRSLITRGTGVILLMAFLAVARRVRSRPDVLPDTGSTWMEDLESDRRFERSLIPREIGVILLIAILVIARQLLS